MLEPGCFLLGATLASLAFAALASQGFLDFPFSLAFSGAFGGLGGLLAVVPFFTELLPMTKSKSTGVGLKGTGLWAMAGG